MSDPNRYERALASDAFEHDDTSNIKGKRVFPYVWNPGTMEYERQETFNPTSVDWSTPGVIVETDGIRTKTTTITSNGLTEEWS